MPLCWQLMYIFYLQMKQQQQKHNKNTTTTPQTTTTTTAAAAAATTTKKTRTKTTKQVIDIWFVLHFLQLSTKTKKPKTYKEMGNNKVLLRFNVVVVVGKGFIVIKLESLFKLSFCEGNILSLILMSDFKQTLLILNQAVLFCHNHTF